METAKERSREIRGVLARAQQLKRDPSWYRNIIMTEWYADWMSLEALSAETAGWSRQSAETMRQEVARRRALPDAEREALEEHGAEDFPKRRMTFDDWKSELAKLKTSKVEQLLREAEAEWVRTPEVYAKYRERFERTSQEAEEKLAKMDSGVAVVGRGVKVPVPVLSSEGRGSR